MQDNNKKFNVGYDDSISYVSTLTIINEKGESELICRDASPYKSRTICAKKLDVKKIFIND